MPLTDTACKNARPKAKPYKLADGGGLYLHVLPAGGRYWRLAYRFGGKQKLLAIGVYPTLGLADARRYRDEAKALLANGADPGEVKKQAKAEAVKGTPFKAVAEEYLKKRHKEGTADVTLRKAAWLLDMAYPDLGARAIATITPQEVLAALRKVEAKGQHETARRLRSILGRVFRYGVASGYCEFDPAAPLQGALVTPKVRHHAAIIDPVEFGGLLRAVEGYTGSPAVKAGLQLMAYLFPRPGELRAAEWSEFDLDRGVWVIPAARTKMRREHKAPLPRQAVAILKGLEPLTRRSRFVFPGGRTYDRCMSDNTMNAALRTLGYSGDRHVAHGFRSSASSMLNESGKWRPDAIEAALAHVEGDNVRRAYKRNDHWAERVAMAQWWADYIDGLRDGGKVVNFPKGA